MAIVCIFGTFDGVHEGHRSLFRQAREYGDELVAIVAPDSVVERLKNKKPQNNQGKRIEGLEREPLVDRVVLGDEELSTYKVLQEIGADFVCLGYDQDELAEDLLRWKRENNTSFAIKRMESYEPNVYHNSIMNKNSKTKKGMLVAITGPSGVGKTTVLNRLFDKYPEAARLITITTRKMRPGERDGVDYFFVSREEFEGMIEKKELFEWEEVYGNYYGSSKKYLEKLLAECSLVLVSIDPKGARTIMNIMKDKSVVVFISPPSIEHLRKRLEGRGDVDEIMQEKRLEEARSELERADEYDYVVVNKEDEIGGTVKEVQDIIKKELSLR